MDVRRTPQHGRRANSALRLHDALSPRPMASMPPLCAATGLWFPTVSSAVGLLVAESDQPMSYPGYDHLGLLVETWEEVDSLLEQCVKFRERDERMKIKEYDDLKQGPVTVHAFYVKYLLPIYFDVQCLEWEPGAQPEKRWSYS